MRVADIMPRHVIAVRPETAVPEIARLMREHRISGVPVVEPNGRVVGIVTELDLLVRNANLHVPTYLRVLDALIPLGNPWQFAEELRRALGTTAAAVMASLVVTVSPETDLAAAATRLLDRRVNPVPVVDSDQPVGIISRADFVWLLAREGPTAQPPESISTEGV